MNTQKSVNNKLFGNTPKSAPKKRKFKKSRKVSLSRIDELLEQSYQALSNMEFALEMFYEGREKIIGARDIIRFEEPRPTYIHDEIMALGDSLDELGIETPSELVEVSNVLTEAEEKHNELYDQMENIGVNPMVDRL